MSTLLLTSTPSSLSYGSQGQCIKDGGIVDYQRRWRDFILRSITLAAAEIVVVPPLLDLMPAVVNDSKAAATVSAVAINLSARPPRITHNDYLDVKFGSKRGKKGRLVIGLFWGRHAQDSGEFSHTLRQPRRQRCQWSFLRSFDILQR
jgi:hypothetical protein